jgi:hypothetical protein
MLAWNVTRDRRVQQAHLIWFAVTILFAVVVNMLCGTPWWHATAKHIMAV